MFPEDCAARFRPERPLGSGGYGAVWLAHDLKLDRKAAVKLLHADAAEDKEQVARFEQEARITARLAHPNIVAVLDAGAAAGVPWIAYELLEGKTLADAAGRLPIHDALAAIQQVALALEAAHAAGVLHRDVKPANVLSAGDGRWKVADFGIARCSADSRVKTATGVLMGTPVYMAPEQVNGAGSAVSSDLYALGISLYEVLTGEPPFHAAAPLEVLRMHVSETPRPPSALRPELGPELDRLVLKSLEKDPRARFASAGAFVQALAALGGADGATPAAPRRARASQETLGLRTGRASRLQATMPGALAAPATGSRRPIALLAAGALLAIGLGVALRPAPPVPSQPPPSATRTADPPPQPRALEAEVVAFARDLRPLAAVAMREGQRPGRLVSARPEKRPRFDELVSRGKDLAGRVFALPDDHPAKIALAGWFTDLIPLARSVGKDDEVRVMHERLRDWSKTGPDSAVTQVPLTMGARFDRIKADRFGQLLLCSAPKGPPELVAGWVRLRFRVARVFQNQGADPDGVVRRKAVQEAIEACEQADCMRTLLDVDARVQLDMDDHDLQRSTALFDRLLQHRSQTRADTAWQLAVRRLWHDLGRRARLHLDAYDAWHIALLLGRTEWTAFDETISRKVETAMAPLWARHPGAGALLQALREVELKRGDETTRRLEELSSKILADRPPGELRSLRDAYRLRRWCRGLLEVGRQLAHRDRPQAATRCFDAVQTTLDLDFELDELNPERAALELERKNPEARKATNPE